ncbi:DEAD/DEAH box helicase [Algibacter lectus]|uniref:Superfamily I DNA and/or RNA helicase n=1 Tax=Algibacter lectus TaxID=221126 RepID=A0A4R8M7X3_9FLAO|nr:AAA domain-containing protein [Algibacter lectus]MWW25736.1 AAA family ATPase [Algibacter lectus]TDY61018.1 superfamily I DNA and/or RNA helicase [Algibacter lectus]
MEYIFKEIIFKWNEDHHKQKAYNEKQLVNLLYKQNIELELIEKTLSDYSVYFDRVKRYLYSPKWNNLIRDFPSWFNLVDGKEQEITKAFIDEENAIEDDNARLWVVAKIDKKISNSDFGFLYQAVISLPDGVSSPGQEGIPINLWWQDVAKQNNIQGVFLAYYRSISTIIFRVSNELTAEHLNTTFKFKPKAINFLKHIKDRFNAVKYDELSLTNRFFFKRNIRIDDDFKGEIIDASLNQSQQKAVQSVFSQNVTFIWGPPGTGKTYTLSKIIAKACTNGLRVLAVSISNISIDILGKEIINEFENFSESSKKLLEDRKVLRFGYPVLSEIVNDSRLYPKKEEVDRVRKEYGTVLKYLRSHSKNTDREDIVRARNKQILLKNEIKQINQTRIANSQLVFTTAAQCFLADNFEHEKFDLVVVDEVGMMPLIQTLTMASFSKNKFVVAGDFKQLGPISTGQTEAVNNWFNKDVFEYMDDVEGYDENIRVMLSEQRRMHPDICSLINDRFYNGLLTSNYQEKFTSIKFSFGVINTPYCFIPVEPKNGAVVKTTQGRSRVNDKSAQVVTELVESLIIENEAMIIGVITPYNGQVINLKRKLRNKMLSDNQLKNVTVGTIHSFQGSGFDAIVYDIVDNCEKNIGMLYKGIQGERLVNVALSRAKHKLIIVGDPKVFSISDDLNEVSKKLRSLMVDLRLSDYKLSYKN